jgi:hypothetical protein
MKNDSNLEDFRNSALSSFQLTLSNVTAIARIYVMEMRTAFIHRIFNTAIKRLPSINTVKLTCSVKQRQYKYM